MGNRTLQTIAANPDSMSEPFAAPSAFTPKCRYSVLDADFLFLKIQTIAEWQIACKPSPAMRMPNVFTQPAKSISGTNFYKQLNPDSAAVGGRFGLWQEECEC
jgi:hypothetical protein